MTRKYHDMGEVYVDLQRMVLDIQTAVNQLPEGDTASELTSQTLYHLMEARALTARIYADAMLIDRVTGC